MTESFNMMGLLGSFHKKWNRLDKTKKLCHKTTLNEVQLQIMKKLMEHHTEKIGVSIRHAAR
jgi:hypothetical protein